MQSPPLSSQLILQTLACRRSRNDVLPIPLRLARDDLEQITVHQVQGEDDKSIMTSAAHVATFGSTIDGDTMRWGLEFYDARSLSWFSPACRSSAMVEACHHAGSRPILWYSLFHGTNEISQNFHDRCFMKTLSRLEVPHPRTAL